VILGRGIVVGVVVVVVVVGCSLVVGLKEVGWGGETGRFESCGGACASISGVFFGVGSVWWWKE